MGVWPEGWGVVRDMGAGQRDGGVVREVGVWPEGRGVVRDMGVWSEGRGVVTGETAGDVPTGSQPSAPLTLDLALLSPHCKW